MTYWEAKNILRRQAAGTDLYPLDVLAEAEQVVEDIDRHES